MTNIEVKTEAPLVMERDALKTAAATPLRVDGNLVRDASGRVVGSFEGDQINLSPQFLYVGGPPPSDDWRPVNVTCTASSGE